MAPLAPTSSTSSGRRRNRAAAAAAALLATQLVGLGFVSGYVGPVAPLGRALATTRMGWTTPASGLPLAGSGSSGTSSFSTKHNWACGHAGPSPSLLSTRMAPSGGMDLGSSSVVGVLDEEQMRALGEIADRSIVQRLVQGITEAVHKALASSGLSSAEDVIAQMSSFLDGPMRGLQDSLGGMGLSSEQAEACMAACGLLAVSAVLKVVVQSSEESASDAQSEDEKLPKVYNLDDIAEYYRKRPVQLARRFLEVSSSLSWFAIELLRDILTEKWTDNLALRGRQLRELCTSNGPAFIKVGQAASIRPDILPAPWITEMELLQDMVEPFGAQAARATMEKSFGRKLESIFEDTSVFKKPIASASLGQVYKARLKSTGAVVAVKVQRPNVLYTVTRDLYVMRLILDLLSKVDRVGPLRVGDSATAFRNLVDSWAIRFLEEMDYTMEAANSDRFRNDMSKSEALGQAIIVPDVHHDMTDRYVLVTDWIDGVKVSSIDISTPSGKAHLATIQATLLNSYLTQLLEAGFLHADPHPGNFLVTADGKLAILDYGLMTEVTEEQRYALVEYVTHLIAKDYDATLNDLIVLEFIDPAIGEDPEKAKLVVPLLATVLEQLSEGGGAGSITIESVGEEVQELARSYPIGIPSYFGLIIRAFGALEGLGLRLDPGRYSIVKECFPYLARRLLTDDSPRMRQMLRTFLYGKDGHVLQVDAVDELVEGYTTFTALAAEASQGSSAMRSLSNGDADSGESRFGFVSTENVRKQLSGQKRRPFGLGLLSRLRGSRGKDGKAVYDPLADPVAQEALKLLFAKEGNYVQDIVVEEMARMTDALGREVNLEMLKILGRFSNAMPVRGLLPTSGQGLNPLLLPIQLPYVVLDRVLQRLQQAIELSDEDRQSLNALRRIISLLINVSSRKSGYHYGSDDSEQDTEGESSGSGALVLASREESALTQLALSSLRPRTLLRSARRLAPILPMIAPGASVMGEKFVRSLAGKTLVRIAESITPDGAKGLETRDLLADQAWTLMPENRAPRR